MVGYLVSSFKQLSLLLFKLRLPKAVSKRSWQNSMLVVGTPLKDTKFSVGPTCPNGTLDKMLFIHVSA